MQTQFRCGLASSLSLTRLRSPRRHNLYGLFASVVVYVVDQSLCHHKSNMIDFNQVVTDERGVGVIVEAQHMCMMMRGVGKQNSSMTSSSMLGRFRTDFNTLMRF